MANPFLVLGGIAVGIITAAFGVLAVPGWVASAQDASTVNDLSSIRIAQSAAASQHGAYFDDIADLTAGRSGVVATLSRGTNLLGLATDGDKAWCAAAQSESGGFFAVSSSGIDTTRHDDAAQAMTAAGCRRASADAILDDTYGTPTEVRRNLAINPHGGTFKATSDTRFGFAKDRWPALGTYSTVDGWVRYTATGSTNSHGFHISSNPDLTGAWSDQVARVEPGKPYSISLRTRMSAGATAADGMLCYRFGNDSNTWTSNRVCPADRLALTSTPRTVSMTFTPPAGSTRVAAYFVATVNRDSYIEATDLLVEQSATPGAFFDGDTTPANSRQQIAWLGEPGNSESVLSTRRR